MTNVHRIHLRGGRFQIDLRVHATGLVEISISDIRSDNIHVFNGTLGSLISDIRNGALFRENGLAQAKCNKVLRGLLREAQFYSHNRDLDQRIEDALNGKPKPTESSTETDQDGK